MRELHVDMVTVINVNVTSILKLLILFMVIVLRRKHFHLFIIFNTDTPPFIGWQLAIKKVRKCKNCLKDLQTLSMQH